MRFDPDTGDYSKLPSEAMALAGVPSRDVLQRMGMAWPAWLDLDATARIIAVARFFPGMAYVDRPFNPIQLTIAYLNKYAEQSRDAFLAPAGQVPTPASTLEAEHLRAQSAALTIEAEHLRAQSDHLREAIRCLRESNRGFRFAAGAFLLTTVALVLSRE